MSRVIDFTNKNPWTWAVYIVVFGLPLSLVLYFAFNKKQVCYLSLHYYVVDLELELKLISIID